jgi:hypothetical protein
MSRATSSGRCTSSSINRTREGGQPSAHRPERGSLVSLTILSNEEPQMTDYGFPVGLEMDVAYPNFRVSLTLLSVEHLRFEIKDGPFARTETVEIQVVPLGNAMFAVSWQEQSGATVTNVPGLRSQSRLLIRDAARRRVLANDGHHGDHAARRSDLR